MNREPEGDVRAADKVTIVECPRDAWQGLAYVIPTDEKVEYLTRLVSLGFRHVEPIASVMLADLFGFEFRVLESLSCGFGAHA